MACSKTFLLNFLAHIHHQHSQRYMLQTSRTLRISNSRFRVHFKTVSHQRKNRLLSAFELIVSNYGCLLGLRAEDLTCYFEDLALALMPVFVPAFELACLEFFSQCYLFCHCFSFFPSAVIGLSSHFISTRHQNTTATSSSRKNLGQ